MGDVSELNERIEELNSQIRSLEMQRELLLSSASLKSNDNAGAIEHIAKAVDYGYKGDYSFVGAAISAGLYGIKPDYDRGKLYLDKFYSDYKLSNLKDVTPNSICNVIFNLAASECYICDRDDKKFTPKVRSKILKFYREFVDIAVLADELSEEVANELYQVGVILYSGYFESPKHTPVSFKPDKKNGLRALIRANKLGSIKAKEYLESEGII